MQPSLREPKKLAKAFAEELKDLLGSNLKAVFLYGSIVSGEFSASKSNLNFLIVLDKLDPLTISRLTERSGRWTKKFKIEPLFFTKKEILESLEAFPIEFLDIKDKHILIFGDNIFRKIKIMPRDLRMQCEKELRGKLILLRQGYLRNKRNARALLAQSAGSIIVLLRSMLRLKKEKIPLKREEVIKLACEEFELDDQPFLKALEIKYKPIVWPSKELHFTFQNYVEELKKLVNKVNSIKVRK